MKVYFMPHFKSERQYFKKAIKIKIRTIGNAKENAWKTL